MKIQGYIEWSEWGSWGACSLTCWFDSNSLPTMVRARKNKSNESHTQTQQSVCQNLTICPTGKFLKSFFNTLCYEIIKNSEIS